MRARIYRPARTAMSSGAARTKTLGPRIPQPDRPRRRSADGLDLVRRYAKPGPPQLRHQGRGHCLRPRTWHRRRCQRPPRTGPPTSAPAATARTSRPIAGAPGPTDSLTQGPRAGDRRSRSRVRQPGTGRHGPCKPAHRVAPVTPGNARRGRSARFPRHVTPNTPPANRPASRPDGTAARPGRGRPRGLFPLARPGFPAGRRSAPGTYATRVRPRPPGSPGTSPRTGHRASPQGRGGGRGECAGARGKKNPIWPGPGGPSRDRPARASGNRPGNRTPRLPLFGPPPSPPEGAPPPAPGPAAGSRAPSVIPLEIDPERGLARTFPRCPAPVRALGGCRGSGRSASRPESSPPGPYRCSR